MTELDAQWDVVAWCVRGFPGTVGERVEDVDEQVAMFYADHVRLATHQRLRSAGQGQGAEEFAKASSLPWNRMSVEIMYRGLL